MQQTFVSYRFIPKTTFNVLILNYSIHVKKKLQNNSIHMISPRKKVSPNRGVAKKKKIKKKKPHKFITSIQSHINLNPQSLQCQISRTSPEHIQQTNLTFLDRQLASKFTSLLKMIGLNIVSQQTLIVRENFRVSVSFPRPYR